MNLSRLKIGSKLGLGFASVLVLTLLLGPLALFEMGRLSAKTEHLATHNLPSVAHAAEWAPCSAAFGAPRPCTC